MLLKTERNKVKNKTYSATLERHKETKDLMHLTNEKTIDIIDTVTGWYDKQPS